MENSIQIKVQQSAEEIQFLREKLAVEEIHYVFLQTLEEKEKALIQAEKIYENQDFEFVSLPMKNLIQNLHGLLHAFEDDPSAYNEYKEFFEEIFSEIKHLVHLSNQTKPSPTNKNFFEKLFSDNTPKRKLQISHEILQESYKVLGMWHAKCYNDEYHSSPAQPDEE